MPRQIRRRLRKPRLLPSTKRFSPLTDKMMRGRGLTPSRGVRGRRGTTMAL